MLDVNGKRKLDSCTQKCQVQRTRSYSVVKTKTAGGKIAGKIRKAATRRGDPALLMTKLLGRIVSEIVRSSIPSLGPISVSLSASVIWVTLQLRSGRWSSARNKTAPEQRLHSTMKWCTAVHTRATPREFDVSNRNRMVWYIVRWSMKCPNKLSLSKLKFLVSYLKGCINILKGRWMKFSIEKIFKIVYAHFWTVIYEIF